MNSTKLVLLLIVLLSVLLRVPNLDKYPPALFSDEANQGYNAYLILTTARDEHGRFLPVSLRSFGDWKPPLQTYLMVPFIAVFGLNEFATRLPTSILAVLSVILTYGLVNELIQQNKKQTAQLASLLVAISPWHLHESRASMLVMVGLFFLTLGIYFFFKAARSSKYYYLSFVSFSLCIYSYYGSLIVVPLMIGCLLIYRIKSASRSINNILKGLVLFGLLLAPLAIGAFINPDVILGRAKNLSIFKYPQVKLVQSRLLTEDILVPQTSTYPYFFHNKIYLYALDFTQRIFVHLSGEFLFLTGDLAPPFRIPGMGVLYLLDSVFLVTGLVALFYKEKQAALLFISWIIVSLIPAALTFMTPSHNRTFYAVVPLYIFIAYGLYWWTKVIQNSVTARKLLNIVLVLLIAYQFNHYLVKYYKILPNEYSQDWLYGFKELFQYLKDNENKYQKIIFLPETGQAYIYQLFYYPESVTGITDISRSFKPDKFGYEHVLNIGKYHYYQISRDTGTYENLIKDNEIYIGRDSEIPKEKSKYEILYPNKQTAFRLWYL